MTTIPSCFIIAEAGVNHNGSLQLAMELIDIAADCCADAIKFQTFQADKLVRPGVSKADYQKVTTGAGDQHSMLSALELSVEMHQQLFKHCAFRGIEFMSTPFDPDSADFLLELGMRRFKIPSGEITNYPFLRHLARKDVPLILSTGMSTLSEIESAIDVIRTERTFCGFTEPLDHILTVLHCTSNYPASFSDVNLRAMQTIFQATNLPVGYSDHTLGISVSAAAVALGATVIEKHFTTDKSLPGPDHKASLEPPDLHSMVEQIRTIEMSLGSSIKEPALSEFPVRDLVRRSVTSSRDLSAGHPLQATDVCLLRPGTGIQPADLSIVLGRSLKHPVTAGTTLQWSDFA